MIAEGTWTCQVLGARLASKNGEPTVEIRVELTEGPSSGQQCEYVEPVNDRTAPYVQRSTKAVGWAGVTLGSLESDCSKWAAKTGGKTTATIKHLTVKSGPRAGQPFAKVQGIGRIEKVLDPVDRAGLAAADAAMASLKDSPF